MAPRRPRRAPSWRRQPRSYDYSLTTASALPSLLHINPRFPPPPTRACPLHGSPHTTASHHITTRPRATQPSHALLSTSRTFFPTPLDAPVAHARRAIRRTRTHSPTYATASPPPSLGIASASHAAIHRIYPVAITRASCHTHTRARPRVATASAHPPRPNSTHASHITCIALCPRTPQRARPLRAMSIPVAIAVWRCVLCGRASTHHSYRVPGRRMRICAFFVCARACLCTGRASRAFWRCNMTLCPSGLRGWTQVPLVQTAWAQIPQVSLSCGCSLPRLDTL